MKINWRGFFISREVVKEEEKMEFRLAILGDLPQLKRVYADIVEDIKTQNLEIWDEIYPCEFFEEDIRKKRLYVLTDKDEVVSAFALTQTNSGESPVEWTNKSDKFKFVKVKKPN